MQLEPLLGGGSAVSKTPEVASQEVRAEQRHHTDDPAALYKAAEDWNLLSRSVWRLRFWRTWPQWSTPPECSRI
eukprot:837833-Pyramimonas_sp.AAC.1